MPEYRIREGVVEVCNGDTSQKQRRFLAERRVKFLGVIPIWWPVTDDKWRASRETAMLDAEHDAYLQLPLSEPQLFTIEAKERD